MVTMKYRLTLTKDEAQIKRLKEKGAYPFRCGGVDFFEDTVHECDDLRPFSCDSRFPKVPTDPRLVVQSIDQTKDKPQVIHGDSPD